MKKKFLISILLFAITAINLQSTVFAKTYNNARKNAQVQEISRTLDNFTMKIYTKSLFSPEENEELIKIKTKLDNQLLLKKDTELALLYYKAGNLYKAREYKNEAAECYQTLINNFGGTIYAQKAKKELSSI